MANLTQWLNAEKIQYIERVSDWKEAIQVTGNPLCREGAISQDYIDTIVRLKEETGPYFVIAPESRCHMRVLNRARRNWACPS